MPPATFQFPILAPQDCEGCGLCCEGIGSPVAIYAYRLSHAGGYLYRPPNLPPELGEEIDAYFGGLKGGEEPLGHCLWFDPETRRCKHHTWRPNVCRQYEVGCDACLDERRPYVTGDQSETSVGLAAAERIDESAGIEETDPVRAPVLQRPDFGPLAGVVVAYVFMLFAIPLGWPLGWQAPLVFAFWFGLLFGVGPLTAIWCVLGPGPWFLRCAIIPLELAAIYFSPFPREAHECLVLPAIVSAIPLAMARSLGLSLGWPPAGSLGGDLRLPQFTVRHLLGWTVAAALLVAAGQQAHQWIGRPFLTILAFAVPLSLGAWGTLWAAMGPRFEYSRWLVTLIACLLANTLTVAALRFSPNMVLPAILVQMVAVLAVLLSLRKAGVRWLT